MCDLRGKFLFEVCPSLFPEGELTSTEVMLWEVFYIEKNSRDKK